MNKQEIGTKETVADACSLRYFAQSLYAIEPSILRFRELEIRRRFKVVHGLEAINSILVRQPVRSFFRLGQVSHCVCTRWTRWLHHRERSTNLCLSSMFALFNCSHDNWPLGYWSVCVCNAPWGSGVEKNYFSIRVGIRVLFNLHACQTQHARQWLLFREERPIVGH